MKSFKPLANPFNTSRLRAQRGIVLPATLALMVAVAGVGTVAVRSGIVTTSQTSRDSATKKAVAAAAAGIRAAIYETNMTSQLADTECVTKDGNGTLGKTTVGANGWCPQPLTETLGDGASYSVEVSSAVPSGTNTVARRYVATGIIDLGAREVRRRVYTGATSATGASIFPGGYAVFSINSFDMFNSSSVIGNVGSNHNINMFNFASICGNASYGPGAHGPSDAESRLSCPEGQGPPGTWSELADDEVPDERQLPPTNDNARIPAPGAAPAPGQDTWTNPGSSSWSQSTRVLQLANSATLTLSGTNYVFCRLRMFNYAKLYIAAGATVTIWLDKPENCPAGNGGVDLNNNTEIVNLNGTSPATLQLNVLGSSNFGSQVVFNNSFNSPLPMLIWAPRSSVSVRNDVHILGSIWAQAVNLTNYASVTYHQDAADPSDEDGGRVFFRQDWIDCTPGPTGATPDTGC